MRFTHHAQYRISERNIGIEDIKSVISAPDYSTDTHDGCVLARKKVVGGTLEVIYRKEKNVIIITTIYFL